MHSPFPSASSTMPMMLDNSTLVHAVEACGGCPQFSFHPHPVYNPDPERCVVGHIDAVCGLHDFPIAYWWRKNGDWEVNCLQCVMSVGVDGGLSAKAEATEPAEAVEAAEEEVGEVLTARQRV